MAFTQDDLNALMEDQAQEGTYLEFKRGTALSRNDDHKNELVKDCVGFANAAGGMIIYGIAEQQINGVNAAASLSPVTANGVDKNWISEVLRSNTSPPLISFEISEIALPRNEGRIVAIRIEASSTAHQSLRDHRYYQRTGAVTSPMVDFQIRDVMNRRRRPEVQVDFRMLRDVSPNLHRYQIEATLGNVGSVTLEKWWLEIDLPPSVVRDTRNPHYNAMITQPDYSNVVRPVNDRQAGRIIRIAFGDPDWRGRSRVLHPGQSLEFESRNGDFPFVMLEIDEGNWAALDRAQTPILWRMFVPNSPPIEGEWVFQEWCHY